MSAAAQRRVATPQEAGRSCPYCRFPLKDAVDVLECGACSSVHHAECWTDNHGCAIVGCAAGPGATATEVMPAPPGYGVTPPPQPQVPTQLFVDGNGLPVPPLAPLGAAPPPRPLSRGPWLAAAIVILALAIGGAATAYVVTSKKDKAPATVTTTTTTTSDDGGTSSVEPGVDGQTASSVLPDESRAQMRDDIQTLLLDWHNDIVNSDFSAAWNLMTPRKRSQKEAEEGYDSWVQAQQTLADYLDPSGLTVSIRKLDPTTGVATVYVSGMRWNDPNSSCAYWEGITWVKYENGEWLYEPGYSTTPKRRRKWEPRRAETLGWGC